MINSYIKTLLESVLEIKKIISLHYFEYVKDFHGLEESHGFWEFVYVDSGEISALTAQTWKTLHSGEVVFHKPYERHNVVAKGNFASVFISGFDCMSPAMSFFNNKIIKLTIKEREIIATFFTEGQNAFQGPFDIMGQRMLTKKKRPKYGAEQLVKLKLEELLIQIIRRHTSETQETDSTENIGLYKSRIVDNVIMILTNNIEEKITLNDITAYLSFSKSYLEKVFHEKMHCGIMQYYLKQKISSAKRLISQNEYTFTEIAQKLNFDSIHHFSRTFKKQTGMSPSEYHQSVKIRALL